jgi:hypothetical protein
MGNFLLVSQRLTRSGQGETPFHYFELYLITVGGFPLVALAMMGYYSRYPAIAQQNLATLFPFLDDMKDHLTKTDPASPFSGAAKEPAQTPARRPGKKHTKRDQKRGQQQQPQSSRTTRCGPTTVLAGLFACALDMSHVGRARYAAACVPARTWAALVKFSGCWFQTSLLATRVRAPVGSCCGHILTAAVSASSSHGSTFCRGVWARHDGWMDGCAF